MTEAAELIRWVQAQFNADEEGAREAAARPGKLVWALVGEPGLQSAQARHIAAWDPARVLAEIAARRAIILVETVGERPEFKRATYFPITLHLAQPYAGRPGWQPEWTVHDWGWPAPRVSAGQTLEPD